MIWFAMMFIVALWGHEYIGARIPLQVLYAKCHAFLVTRLYLVSTTGRIGKLCRMGR